MADIPFIKKEDYYFILIIKKKENNYFILLIQNGTLAGNITIKKQHPEFPSDVFITFEALDVQVLVHESATSSQVMSLLGYLQDPRPKLVIGGFILRAYPKEKYLFNSYKVSPQSNG